MEDPMTTDVDRHQQRREDEMPPTGARTPFATPAAVLGVLLVIVLAMSWQFMSDASRAVPAFDTAYYQWRAELVQHADPGRLITLRGATGALAAGYRVAEAVLGGLMRTVGGIGAETHTVVLSVMLRVLAGLGLAAFAWQRRRSWLLFYLALVTVPALFLLQRFFGYLDNFLTLSLLVGVLLLVEPMRWSWAARIGAASFMLIAGLSHPTTLVIFLLAIGVAIVYELVRNRSLAATWRAWWPTVAAGTAAVVGTAAFWLGGLWGPTSSFSDAAVPPPASVQYFLDRSVGVLKNLQPFDQATAPSLLVWAGVAILVALMVAAFVHLVMRALRDREEFATLTVAWTLPLAGMGGFLIGAAYPYFRFFNATLAPLLLVAVGLALVIAWAFRRGDGRSRALPVAVVVVVAALVGGWWFRGLSSWNSTGTWLTPDVRAQVAAARGFLEASPEGTKALFVVDSPPVEGQSQVPYGRYKEFANALYAQLGGEIVDDRLIGEGLYFGRIEDLQAGGATETGDEIYDGISADTAEDVLGALREESASAVVFMPTLFNEGSPNQEAGDSRELGDSGMAVLEDLTGPEVTDEQVAAAEAAAGEAATFAASTPGPFTGIGSTLLAILRLALLFGVPGLLWYLALRERSWVEALALVPMLSIGLVSTVAIVVLAVVRSPLSPALAWASWAIASVLGLALWLVEGRREPRRA